MNIKNVFQLMPNCPFRDHKDIINSYRKFINLKSKSLISHVKFYFSDHFVGFENKRWKN